jgi:hypothetical protein
MWHRHISGVLMAWAVVGIASAASAQHAPTFADLATHLRAGDGVRVEHRDGTRFSGTVVAVTPDALVLAGPSGRQSFTATTTRRVARVGDSVLNGALFGLLPGFLFGLELPRATSDQRVNEGSGVKAGIITGLIGAAIGMAVDGARDGETELYVTAPPARVTVAPFVGRGAMGATASVGW